MIMYFIGAGVLILLWAGWYYRKLLIQSLGLKSAKREAKIHAKINEKNKEIDKAGKIKHDEIKGIDQDNMLAWLQKKMKLKNKEKK